MNFGLRDRLQAKAILAHKAKSKCLIVDDLDENLIALQALLKSEEVEVYPAKNGVEALHLMLTHEFALALVDVQMPEMDGFELAELMRSSERTKRVPIIFVTAGESHRDRLFKGYELGAVDFIFKPVEPRVLRSKAKFFLDAHVQKRKLIEAEERFRSMFEGAGVGMANVRLDGRWIKLNAKFSELLGEIPGELPQDLWLDRLHPGERVKELKEIALLLNGDATSYSCERKLRMKNGTFRSVLMTVSLVRNTYGDPTDLILSAQDISALKRAQDEVIAANRIKSEFLANMSHEIRTPMTAILGFSEMLTSNRIDEDRRQDYVQRIRSNSDHLLNLIDDILDLSKLDAGSMNIVHEPTDLASLANESLFSLRSMAEKKKIELKLEIESGVPRSINVDSHRIRQVMTNLIGNAIKFTSEGHVCLRLKNSSTPTLIEAEVVDTGTGIAPESTTKIFQPFAQADSSMTRRFGGTGLGLALSRKMARALGGDLELRESTLGKGSCFVFRFPTNLPLESSMNSADEKNGAFLGVPMGV